MSGIGKRLLALALLLASATPAAAYEPGADYILTPLGHRWYQLSGYPDVTLPTPDGAWALTVTLDLDDVPGGLASAPQVSVRPLRHPASSQYAITPVWFFPTFYGRRGYTPTVRVLIRNESGAVETYRIKVNVRGEE